MNINKTALAENKTAVNASLADLQWMCGAWVGGLGDQIAEESWSQPTGGTMGTMVRLSSGGQTLMFELIVIREEQGSLVAHLRQFSPELELRLAQDMPIIDKGPTMVAFKGPADSSIKQLTYRGVAESRMEVDVMLGDDSQVTATFERA